MRQLIKLINTALFSFTALMLLNACSEPQDNYYPQKVKQKEEMERRINESSELHQKQLDKANELLKYEALDNE